MGECNGTTGVIVVSDVAGREPCVSGIGRLTGRSRKNVPEHGISRLGADPVTIRLRVVGNNAFTIEIVAMPGVIGIHAHTVSSQVITRLGQEYHQPVIVLLEVRIEIGIGDLEGDALPRVHARSGNHTGGKFGEQITGWNSQRVFTDFKGGEFLRMGPQSQQNAREEEDSKCRDYGVHGWGGISQGLVSHPLHHNPL